MIYYDIFLQELKFLANSEYLGAIYLQLFSLRTEADLNTDIEYLYELSRGKNDYFKKSGKEHWFEIWHKTIRQTDYFSNCYQKVKMDLLTKEEEKEYKYLIHKYRTENQNKEGKDGELFNDEYKKLLEMNDKKRRENYDYSINGKLDSILWNTIHVDTKGLLYELFTIVFTKIDLKLKSLQKELK